MNFRIPIITYGRKKGPKSKLQSTHVPNRIPDNYAKPSGLLWDDGIFETTFDQLAKDVRIPLPPPDQSVNSINFSSDVSIDNISDTNIKSYNAKYNDSSLASEINKGKKRSISAVTKVKPTVIKSRRITEGKTPVKILRSHRLKKDLKHEIETALSDSSIEVEIRKTKKRRKHANHRNSKRPNSQPKPIISEDKQKKSRDVINTVKSSHEKIAEYSNQVFETDHGTSVLENEDNYLNEMQDIERSSDKSISERPVSSIHGSTEKLKTLKVKGKKWTTSRQKKSNCVHNNADSEDFSSIKQILPVISPVTRTSAELEDIKRTSPLKQCSIILFECDKNTRMKRKSKTKFEFDDHSSCADMFCTSNSHITADNESKYCRNINGRPNDTENERENLSGNNPYNTETSIHLETKPDPILGKSYDTYKRIGKKETQMYSAAAERLISSTPLNKFGSINKSMHHLSPISQITGDSKIRLEMPDERENIDTASGSIDWISNSEMKNSDVAKRLINFPRWRNKLFISYEKRYKNSENSEMEVNTSVLNKKSESNTYKKPSRRLIRCTRASRYSQPEVQYGTENSSSIINGVDQNDECNSNLCQSDIIRETINLDGIETSHGTLDHGNSISEESSSRSEYAFSQPTPYGIITTRSGKKLRLSCKMRKNILNGLMNPEVQLETLDICDTNHSDAMKRLAKTSLCTPRRLQATASDSVPNNDIFQNKISTSDHSSCVISSDCIDNTSGSTNCKIPFSSDLTALNNTQTSALGEASKLSVVDESSVTKKLESLDVPCNLSNDVGAMTRLYPDREVSENVIDEKQNFDSVRLDESTIDLEQFSKADERDSEWSTIESSEIKDNIVDRARDNIDGESKKTAEKSRTSHRRSHRKLSNNDQVFDDSVKANHDRLFEMSHITVRKRIELSSRNSIRSSRSSQTSRSRSNTYDEQDTNRVFNDSKRDDSSAANQLSATNIVEEEDSDRNEQHESIENNPNLRNVSLGTITQPNMQPMVIVEKLKYRRPLKMERKPLFGLSNIDESLNECTKAIPIISPEVSKKCRTLTENSTKINEKLELQPVVVLKRIDYPLTSISNQRTLRKSSLIAMPEAADDCVRPNPKNNSTPIELNINELPIVMETMRRTSQPTISELENDTISLKFEPVSACDLASNFSERKMSEYPMIERRSVFLKPGKHWARSLSILNNINQGLDLDTLIARKGKKWSLSVQAVVEMQKGVTQSCLGAHEDDKTTQTRLDVYKRPSVPSAKISCSQTQSVQSASPSRLVRRMSVRVVPDNKRPSFIGDASFLEVYGISAIHGGRELSRSSTIKPRRTTLVHDVQCETLGIETLKNKHIGSARDVVLQRCGQDDYLTFDECFPDEYLEYCRKIGEGVYGEVFLYDNGQDKSVIKIIPIEGSELVNGEQQKRFHEILSEIVIAKELDNLRYDDQYQTHGFAEVKSAKCIIGKYPDELVELWQCYDNEKGSDNDCPSLFDENQLYIVLELGHGGQDLEAYVFDSAVQAHALFVQIALALAVAEQRLEFEHRDLHWGNVLITKTNESHVSYKIRGREYSYPTKGVQVAIIDFTLSRMSYEGCCIFNDLESDPALFTAQGEYQFEIYRLMREKVAQNWQNFEPYTNILWLHYTLDKMITALRYKRKSTKKHREAIYQLQELKDVILNYESAYDLVINCDKITSLEINAGRN